MYILDSDLLKFRIEVWDVERPGGFECLAAFRNITPAQEAWPIFVQNYPNQTLTLRDRTRVIRTTEHD